MSSSLYKKCNPLSSTSSYMPNKLYRLPIWLCMLKMWCWLLFARKFMLYFMPIKLYSQLNRLYMYIICSTSWNKIFSFRFFHCLYFDTNSSPSCTMFWEKIISYGKFYSNILINLNRSNGYDHKLYIHFNYSRTRPLDI